MPKGVFQRTHNKPPEVRFWKHVDKNGRGGCWLWTAHLSIGGYGTFSRRQGVPEYAHRLAYEWTAGAVPEGMELDHLCRTRNCVNPVHLEAVTRSENVRRGLGPAVTKLRHLAKLQCPSGHAYTPQNTYRSPSTHRRQCRLCNRERKRLRRRALGLPLRKQLP